MCVLVELCYSLGNRLQLMFSMSVVIGGTNETPWTTWTRRRSSKLVSVFSIQTLSLKFFQAVTCSVCICRDLRVRRV